MLFKQKILNDLDRNSSWDSFLCKDDQFSRKFLQKTFPMKLDSIHFYDFEHFYCKISSLKSVIRPAYILEEGGYFYYHKKQMTTDIYLHRDQHSG